MDMMIEYTGKGFLIMLLLSMPSVLTAAGIGLVVGILQAVTQVQEQTIAAAPKMLGVFIVIMIMGPFSIRTLQDYFRETTNIAFEVLPKTDQMVLSDNDFYAYRKKVKDDTHYGDRIPSYKDYKDNPGKLPFADTTLKEVHRKPMKGSDSSPNFIEQKQIYSGKKGN